MAQHSSKHVATFSVPVEQLHQYGRKVVIDQGWVDLMKAAEEMSTRLT
jgi:hypothetical protein